MMDHGGELVFEETQADILLLNTCSFIADSRAESCAEIERLIPLKAASKKLYVLGCLPQLWQQNLLQRYPQIDGIMGVNDLRQGVKSLLAGKNQFFTDPQPIEDSVRAILTAPHSVYLKIAEGCDHSCAFCTIPSIRGHFRSRELATIVAEAQLLVDNGVKEISLLAQDSTSYGRDIYGRLAFPELLKELDKLGVWIRIMYMYPATITDELLDSIASCRHVLPYFDIPFQHVSSSILGRMGRGNVDVVELVAKIRKIDRSAIRATFIVGYPGETEEEFEELKKFVSNSCFDRLAVFAYSQEDGTIAAGLVNQVAENVKQERLAQIVNMHSGVVDEYNEEIIGKEIKVLFDNELVGRTYRDAPNVDGYVELVAGEAIAGEIYSVKVTQAQGYVLKGEISDNSNIHNFI